MFLTGGCYPATLTPPIITKGMMMTGGAIKASVPPVRNGAPRYGDLIKDKGPSLSEITERLAAVKRKIEAVAAKVRK